MSITSVLSDNEPAMTLAANAVVADKPKPPFYPSRGDNPLFSECKTSIQLKIPFVSVGKHIHATLEKTVADIVSGKCITEGYVKPGTVKLITFSGGIVSGASVVFDIVYICRVCFPVAGMNVRCRALEITKGGIRAESADEAVSPFVMFVARDLEYASSAFSAVGVGDVFTARVIGQRFELNDTFVSIIGDVVAPHRRREADV